MVTQTQPIAFSGTPTTQMGAVLSDRELYEGIAALVQNRPELKESLTARLSDEVTTSDFSRAVRDTLAPNTHPHEYMYLGRYALPSASADAFVTAVSPETGEVHVLLAMKKDGVIVPPGGHQETHEPVGGRPDKPFDQNLMETSRRELEEETGLKLPANYKPACLGVNSDYGYSSNPQAHNIQASYHYNLICDADKLPPVHGRDDIVAAFWVKAEDIFTAPTLPKQHYDSGATRFLVRMDGQDHMAPLRDMYGDALMQAIARAKQSLQTLQQQKPQAVIQTAQVMHLAPVIQTQVASPILH